MIVCRRTFETYSNQIAQETRSGIPSWSVGFAPRSHPLEGITVVDDLSVLHFG